MCTCCGGHSLPSSPTSSARPQAEYFSPVPPSSFGFLALVLLIAGFVATALYFTSGGGAKGGKGASTAGLLLELVSALAAAALLGSGTFFVFLWAGIWV
jgi:hypothetical protein